jgi:hypothetical protein
MQESGYGLPRTLLLGTWVNSPESLLKMCGMGSKVPIPHRPNYYLHGWVGSPFKNPKLKLRQSGWLPCPNPGPPTANAGATLSATITSIRATTVNDNRMRFFMRYPLSVKCGTRGSPVVSRNKVSMVRYKT